MKALDKLQEARKTRTIAMFQRNWELADKAYSLMEEAFALQGQEFGEEIRKISGFTEEVVDNWISINTRLPKIDGRYPVKIANGKEVVSPFANGVFSIRTPVFFWKDEVKL